MIKKLNIKISIFLISIIIIIGYFLLNSIIENDKFSNIRSLLNDEKKKLIKKYIFPYEVISLQEKKISRQEQILQNIDILGLELSKKESGSDIEIKENNIKLSNKHKQLLLLLWVLLMMNKD